MSVFCKQAAAEDATTVAACAQLDAEYPEQEFTPGMWHFWRTAPTVAAFNSRGVALARAFPTGAAYLRFLRNSKHTWATVYSTWLPTFGLCSTSLQEGLNASIKANLNQVTHRERLHNLVTLMRGSMKSRYLSRELRTAPTKKVLEECAARLGCTEIMRVLRTNLTEESFYLALSELQESQSYKLEPLPYAEIRSVLQQCTHRQGSCARFSCLPAVQLLLSPTTTGEERQQDIGHFFVITKRSSSGSRTDILYVHTNGSFCRSNCGALEC